MGYDLHITRRAFWADDGDDIGAEEWVACVRDDAELDPRPERGAYFAVWSGPSELDEPWLDWDGGRVFAKNPDPALIDKMVSIAAALGAVVQGDDGEVYEAGAVVRPAPTAPAHPSLRERLAGRLPGRQPRGSTRVEPEPLPFAVGDTVYDVWGNPHVVLAIDPAADHGLGLVRTRRADGAERNHSYVAHGFTVDPPKR